jgi:hypothetical protein
MYITFYNPDQEISLEYTDPLSRLHIKEKRKKANLLDKKTKTPRIKIGNIKTFEYLPGHFKKSCGICKTFLRNKVVAECPDCKALFHVKHLKKWLETNRHCPICQQDLLSEEEDKEDEKS